MYTYYNTEYYPCYLSPYDVFTRRAYCDLFLTAGTATSFPMILIRKMVEDRLSLLNVCIQQDVALCTDKDLKETG